MPYGTIKVDTITFTDAGVDKSVAISGLVQNPTFTGNVTATGTISGLIVQAPTVTGTTANFASGVYTTQISGAIVKVPAGSAGAPSIQVGVGASVAPGLYGAGTDLLGISTGGAGRIFIDSTGRLGVGTSNPTARLDLGAPGDVNFFEASNGVDSTLRFRFASNLTTMGNAGATAGLALETNGTERLRIDSSGRVGIGTSSPSNTAGYSQQLEVAGSLPCISINQNNGSFTTRKYSLGVDAVGGFGIWDNTSNSYRFYTNTSGNVGIGTSSPGEALDVGSGNIRTTGTYIARTNARLRLNNNGNSNYSEIYNPNADSGAGIAFNSGAGEAVRIDSSSRLLVGTSTARPTATQTWRSQIESAGEFTGLGITTNLNTTAGAYLSLAKSRGAAVGSNTIVQNGDGLGYILFSGADGTDANTQAAYIGCEVDGTPGVDDMPGRLVFCTTADGAIGPTERMRITSSGLLNVGTATAPSGNHIFTWQGANRCNFNNDDATATNCHGLLINYPNAAPNGTVNEFIYCQDNAAGGTARAVIRANGGLANFQANNVNLSDINTKKDITPSDGTWDCLKQWEIVNYRYKDQPDDADLNLGVIAQQVAESCPEVITVYQEAKEAKDAVLDEDGNETEPAQEAQPERLGIKEQQMYWMAIKALQEAQARIETLEAKVAALEGN